MRTVGQILAEARGVKGITLAEAERNTKIRADTLGELEADNFTALPSPIYIRGFIKSYADYLGVDPDHALAIFRRQFAETQATQVLPDLSPKEGTKLTLTPGRALGLGVSILVLGFVGYLLAQYQSFAAAPLIEVSSPAENLQVNNGTIEVAGRTDRDATLRINGQEIQLTESGAFSVSVTLPDGTTELTLTATNKLGRVTNVSRMVTVTTPVASTPAGPTTPASSQPTVAAATTSGVELTIHITGSQPVKIQRWLDSQTVSLWRYYYPGASDTFEAKESIKIWSSNGGSTEITVNGKNLGSLGSAGQAVTKTFTP